MDLISFIKLCFMDLLGFIELSYAESKFTVWFGIIALIVIVYFVFAYLIRLWTIPTINKKFEKKFSDNNSKVRLRNTLFSSRKWAIKKYDEYLKSWESAIPSGSDKASFPVYLTDYLPQREVIESCCNHRMALALPGILVSLGIFGTFLGVRSGISNINPGNIENLSQEIFVLIAGLKVAFITSLMGISFSVFFTVTHRYLIRCIERKYEKLNIKCYQLLCPCIPDEDSTRVVLEQFDEMNQSIKTLATDMATYLSDSLGPAIGSAMGEHIVPAIETMMQKMDDNSQQLKVHNNKVANVINQSIGGLGDVLNQHLDDAQKRQEKVMDGVLKEYVENMNHTFKDLFNEMGNVVRETMLAQKHIHDGMTDFSGIIRSNFEKQEELLESTTTAAQIMADTIGQFEGITSSVESTAMSLKSTGEVVDRAAEKTKEIYGSVEMQLR